MIYLRYVSHWKEKVNGDKEAEIFEKAAKEIGSRDYNNFELAYRFRELYTKALVEAIVEDDSKEIQATNQK